MNRKSGVTAEKSVFCLTAMLWILVSAVLMTSVAAAQTPPPEMPAPETGAERDRGKPLTAHQVVQEVTDQMLSVINQNQNTRGEKPQQFYSEVEQVLNPVVDFNFIARGVMGAYAKQAAPEQRERFASTFKRGLVVTYAKGMAGFGDRDIVVLPPKGDISGQRTVNVTQEVRGGDGVNRVSYTMKRKRSGEWKLVNVVLNGVNLGKTFRSQFAQAMKKKGDMNVVIADWTAES